MIKHKADFHKTKYVYLGFGHHGSEPTILCVKKGEKLYHIVRNWKDVTCKKCLAKKVQYQSGVKR